MRPTRLPAPAVAVVVLGVVVAAWFGLRGRPGEPARPEAGQVTAPGPGAPSAAESDERAVRLHGRSETPGPSELRGTDTASPGTGPLPPQGPRLPDGEPSQSSSEESEPVRFGPYVCARVAEAGGITFEQGTWTTSSNAPGFELVAYDLSPWAPLGGALMSASHEWWEELVAEVVDAVDYKGWTTSAALIAYDAAQATLYVRQDASAHARVEEVLTHRASRGQRTLRLALALETTGAEPGQRLALDAASNRMSLAQRGRAWAYIQDFDIEVGQDSFTALPIVASLDVGFTVSVRRVDQRRGPGELAVEVVAASDPTGFLRWEIGSANMLVPLELPEVEDVRWRGTLPTSSGEQTIDLEAGRRVTITVTESALGPLPQPLYGRHVVQQSDQDSEDPRTPSRRRLRVVWLEAGPLKGKAIEVPLVTDHTYGDGLLATGTCTVDLRGVVVDPASRVCPWPLQEGGVRIQAATFPAGAVDVLDLRIEYCSPASAVRESTIFPRQTWGDEDSRKEPEPLSLPTCAVRCDTLRVLVPVGADAAGHLGADGNAAFRVSVLRGD